MKLFSKLRALRRATPSGTYSYPLKREDHRVFSPELDGLICVWDIDKTYLASDIDSLRGMLKIPFEFAVDKRTIAGADNLLRLLRRPKGASAASGLYFVSASPNQLRSTIEGKMLLDAVEHDGITLKDWTTIVKRRRFGKLREQIGYKLSALLLARKSLPWRASELLFGDDSESDALIYSLYADICAGRLRASHLEGTLLKNGVANEDARYIGELSRDLPEGEIVAGIFIHTEREESAATLDAWQSQLVACQDTFQMACLLVAQGHISLDALSAQAAALLKTHNYSRDQLLSSLKDLVDRQWLSVPKGTDLCHLFGTVLDNSSEGEPKGDLQKLTWMHWNRPSTKDGYVTPEGFLA